MVVDGVKESQPKGTGFDSHCLQPIYTVKKKPIEFTQFI